MEVVGIALPEVEMGRGQSPCSREEETDEIYTETEREDSLGVCYVKEQ